MGGAPPRMKTGTVLPMILRLNDTFFYLLAATAVTLMVVPQLWIANSQWDSLSEDVLDNGVTIDGDRLSAMAAGQGVGFEMVRDSRGRLVARIHADRPLGDPTVLASAGVFDALQAHELDAMAGYVLRVTYTLNPSEIDGARQLHLGAFQIGIGQSAWQLTELVDGQAEYEVMLYPPRCAPQYTFMGLWPDPTDGANMIDLHRIRVEAVEPFACSNE